MKFNSNKIQIITCAINLSFVFLLLIDMKNAAGNMRQIITPIVAPTIPSTNSMFGIIIPTINEIATTRNVRNLNLVSGM